MAKYEANTKVERNRMLFEYRQAHPELSLQEIGDVFEISRERVRQIILKEARRRRLKNEKAAEPAKTQQP